MMTYSDKPLSSDDLKQVQKGFALISARAGESPAETLRLTVQVREDELFIGCASGLASNSKSWFYLTDLFVKEDCRNQGVGRELLERIEVLASEHGALHIWTRTESHGAFGFYRKCGYEVLFELPGWYSNGHSHIGLSKEVATS